ncbi:MAG: alanyl-tRNA editing protein, partial [Blautia sp.]|nr:alanyl-tRNA editing protein [Blautia sp.]
MPTRRLYYEDAYRRDFSAAVVDCRPKGENFEVCLTETAFFPEGGGQPADHGTLGNAHVLDVHEKEGEVWHLTDVPLTPGEWVEGHIDWERRFDLMQQHSGEHIVSGLIANLYGYRNMGFHMGEDVITIDLSGILTWEDLVKLEKLANEVIAKDGQTEIFYPSPEGLETLEYRSKKELEGEVRIVRFPGADTCACCGTHVMHAGEIQLVHLLSVQKFHEGVRVEMISGQRAVRYLGALDEQNREISRLLSAKPLSTAMAVNRLQEEAFALRGRVRSLEEELFTYKAAAQEGKGDVLLFEEGLESDSLRRYTDMVMHSCKGCCAVFSKNPD